MGCEWFVNGDLNPHGISECVSAVMQRGGLRPLFGAALFPGIGYYAAVWIPDAGSPAAGNTVRA